MKPRIKPRNPLVAPSKFRKAGLHHKPFKTQRRAEQISAADPIGVHVDGAALQRKARAAADLDRSDLQQLCLLVVRACRPDERSVARHPADHAQLQRRRQKQTTSRQVLRSRNRIFLLRVVMST